MSCGTCTMCCKLLGVEDKPAGKWCPHCTQGRGCGIYETRPELCRVYKCGWLLSQDDPGRELPPDLRPDRCKVMISPTARSDLVMVNVDVSARDAWRHGRVAEVIRNIVASGRRAVVSWGTQNDKLLLFLQNGRPTVKAIKMTDPDEHGVQWLRPEDREAAA